AMRIVIRMAAVAGAVRLLDITRAHIDGCLYHGQAGLDFARRLADGGAQVTVPTTLNVASLDLLHPELYRGDPETARAARELMTVYEVMGCRPTWTCAPYQLPERPVFGEQIAWAESNAIVFANSVIGARTDRYGDFLDICAALTGRAPAAGLHLGQNRRGEILFRLVGLSDRLLGTDALYPVLGHLVGARAGQRVPVIEGLPEGVGEDRLKALGAAAASSGSVALFHAVGVTPEAPTLADALHGSGPLEAVEVGPGMIRRARDELSTVSGGRLAAVSVGTPHFSLAELGGLVKMMHGRQVDPEVDFYVSTGRDVLSEAGECGWLEALEQAGVKLVTDTCTYITPILRPGKGVVMTDSGKWAYYAPGNLGVDVVFGGLDECVASALAGRVERDERLWLGG
ncbi:MAG: aconitase X, partial [Acidimicrobiia bacterium]